MILLYLERVVINGFFFNHSLEIPVKRVVSEDSDYDGCFWLRKCLGGPLDEPGEIKKECGLDFSFGRAGLLAGAGTAEKQEPCETQTCD